MIELPGLLPQETERLIRQEPVLLAYRGSLAHGMYVPSNDPDSIDDVDLIEAYVPMIDHYFGLERGPSRGHDIKVKQYDMAAYELRHFAHLLIQANPNVVSALWLKPEMYLVLDDIGKALVENRTLFSSRRVLDSFSGYAYSQLKRMTAYHESGEDSCCAGEKFHLEDCPLSKERGRGSAKKFATGFMGAKRKALVEKFGYDTKNAAHLMRLLRMGLVFAKTGDLVVDRREAGDAEELLAIKRGEWTLRRVMTTAAGLFSEFHAIKDSGSSPLPPEPNQEKVHALLVDLLSKYFY